MKVKFLVIGLNEEWMLNSVSLSSSGISEEREMPLIGHFLQEFDSELEAIEFIQETGCFKEFEKGVEIKKVFIKK